MIVTDASVLANMLVFADERGHRARRVLDHDPVWAAPEHWKAEVFSTIRGLALGHKISESTALRALVRLPHLGIEQVSLDGLLARMWRIRENISGYDGAYVALAQARNLTLTTSDAKLARAATAHCRVELV